MAHLRLVAGTAVAEANKQMQEKALAQALGSAAQGDAAKMEAAARRVIYNLKPGLDGLSVAELLAEMNGHRVTEGTPQSELSKILRRKDEIRAALFSVGISALAAVPEQELDVALYGLVTRAPSLLKACPELKSLKGVLEGITL